MSEWIKRLAEKYSEVNEKKLTGNQHKLDMDKDGDIDGDDFKHMRNKKKTNEDEVVMNPKKEKKEKETMAAEAKIDEISMDKAKSAYVKRKIKAYDAAAQGSMDYAKKQMAKARKTKAYMDKKESIEEDTMHVDIDHMGGHDPHAKKHNITLTPHNNAGNGHGHYAIGKKKDLQKYLAKHYDSHSDAKDIHPEVFKESTLPPIYSRIMEARAAADKDGKHSKKASPPEDWNEKEKNNKGAMDMKKDMAVDTNDKISNYDELGHDDASKAGRATNAAKSRPGDNAAGDKKVVNPVKGATS